MIIRSIFRRYERWNPVHPTYRAFWSIGVGISCGIGWGPGFGPEVIGYVGAGCVLGSLFLVSELAFQPTTFYKLLTVLLRLQRGVHWMLLVLELYLGREVFQVMAVVGSVLKSLKIGWET